MEVREEVRKVLAGVPGLGVAEPAWWQLGRETMRRLPGHHREPMADVNLMTGSAPR